MTATAGGAALLVVGRVPLRRRRVAEEVLRAAGAEGRRPQRWEYVHPTNGPRVLLGVAWAALVGGALWAGPVATAVCFGAVAGVAALQGAAALRRAARQRWRRDGRASVGRPVPLVAGVVAFAVPLATAGSTSFAGVVVLVGTAASIGFAIVRLGGPAPLALTDAGETIRAWLAVALAAASPVVLVRAELTLAVVVIGLACTYDVGDYLVGSAATNRLEGPVAGIVGIGVVTFGLAVGQPGSLTVEEIWQLGALAAVGCPLGQWLASAILPRASAFAPALRRLDSLLVLGPLAPLVLR